MTSGKPTNAVQGVLAVQGHVQSQKNSYRPRISWPCSVLCRVCKRHVRGCARTQKNQLLKITKLPRVYIDPAHPALLAQTNNHAAYSRARSIYTRLICLHTLHTLYFFMTKIICNKENIREINNLLKTHLPEFYEMAKELHRNGMINGLRGVSIELIDPENPQQQDPHEQEHTECRQCRYFLKDLIGDGTGIGKCAKNAWKTVLWPNTAACQDYEARS